MFFVKTIEIEILKYIIYTIGFIYLLISFNYGINIYDEGLILVGGMRVLSGDLPYSDFWTIYAPGTYYFSAFLQIFTTQIWFHKLIAIVISFVIATQLNSIYTLLTRKKHYFVFIAAIIISGFGLKFITASGLGLMMALFAIYSGLKYFRSSNEKYVLRAGILIGLTALFRHDFAAYVFIPFLLSLIFDNNREGLLGRISKLLMGVLPAIVLFAILGAFVGFGNMFDQLVVFPLTKFNLTRSLPFPFIWNAQSISDSMSNYFYNAWIAVMFLVPPVIAIANYLLFRKHKHASLFIFYGLLVLLFYNQALNRSDYEHLLPSLLLALPLVFSVIGTIETRFYRNFALIISAVFLLIIPIGKKANFAKQHYKNNVLVKSNLPALNHIYLDPVQSLQYEYAAEIERNIIKGANTFIGLKDMSSIEINDVMAYYVLDLKPNTRYHELHPGIADNKRYQIELLKELADKNQFVILFDIQPTFPATRSKYFDKNLPEIYSYIIKSSRMDLMINKKIYPAKK